jgi:hypothetical protein
MNWLMLAYIAVLFYVLTPGIIVRIPEKGSKMLVAAVHAVVFAVVYSFTYRRVWLMTEGFQAMATPPAMPAAGSMNPVGAVPAKPSSKEGSSA